MKPAYFKILFFLLFFHFNGHAQLPQCEKGVTFADLDINNVRARYWASGDMWFDIQTFKNHYEVPKGSGIHPFFVFDLWVGAIDEMGRKRTAFQYYAGRAKNAYFPGPLNDMGDTFPEICNEYDRVWKINKSTLDSFRLGLLSEVPKDILEWPARNNPHISFSPEQDLAPFVDANGDDNYNPMDGDIPKILGDQALWWVFNDKGGFGSPTANKTVQIDGHCMAYAYNTIPELQNHTFYQYTLTNKSQLRLDSVMVGMSFDACLGQFDDDYVGCDTLRNLGIFYNGDEIDGDYGENPPILGVKLLQGLPKEDDTYSNMYTFWNREPAFHVWGFPESNNDAFNGLRGLSKNGWKMTYGGEGFNGGLPPHTRYMYPSEPTDANGWSECSEENSPSDRRLFMSTGPVTLQNLEQTTFHFAVLWVREGIEYPCPSFAPIRQAADYVQALFDEGLITNIEEKPTTNLQSSTIHLFPNPAASNAVLYLNQNSNQALQKGILQLFDSLGKLVKSVALKETQRNEIELFSLQSGIYFYRLQWEKGGVENGKLMIQ
ncbi:MAG: T9SS type A sorting domain-containing protein [Chitinophagales bacterium]